MRTRSTTWVVFFLSVVLLMALEFVRAPAVNQVVMEDGTPSEAAPHPRRDDANMAPSHATLARRHVGND